MNVSRWRSRQSLLGKIHGTEVQMRFGQGRTAGVNMVGNDWLCRAGLMLVADYVGLGCALVKSDGAARDAIPALPRPQQ